jgi:hypothetical protein
MYDPELEVEPRFVPEYCVGHESECLLVLGTRSFWGAGTQQQIIRNMKFKMIMSWLNWNMTNVVTQRVARREPVLFYWYIPSAFIDQRSDQLARVALKQYTRECYRNNTRVRHVHLNFK